MNAEIRHLETNKVIHSMNLPEMSLGEQIGIVFLDAIEKGIDLDMADARGAYLVDCKIIGKKLCGVELSDSNLWGADLSLSVFDGALFERTCFNSAKLVGCDFTDAKFMDTDLTGAFISGCNFTGAITERIKVYGHLACHPPIQVSDLYNINIWDGFMTIGNERHSLRMWNELDVKLDKAWWMEWKPILMRLAKDRMNLISPELIDYTEYYT